MLTLLAALSREVEGQSGLFLERIGAQSRSRTGTAFRPRDFKSLVSTNFTTWAQCLCGLQRTMWDYEVLYDSNWSHNWSQFVPDA